MMNTNNFLPEKSESREWRFRPLRTAVICVLIAALLISTSIGFSYAKYASKPGVSATYYTAGLMFDPARYIIKERVPGEDTVFETLNGNVKVTVPATATGSNLDGADYLVLRLDRENYTVDYTKEKNQYTYDCRYYLYGYTYANNDTGCTVGNVNDRTRSITLEMKVGSEYNSDLENKTSINPKSNRVPHSYDAEKQAVVFSGIGTFRNASTSNNTTDYFLSYDKRSWSSYAPNADDIGDWYDPSADVMTISDGQELAELSTLVEGGITFEGKTIRLADDISLYSNDLRLDIADNTSTYEKRPWKPIGTYEHPFMGSFEGDDHTISGLNIRQFGSDTSDKYSAAGLFGYVSNADGATIENFTISDAHISAKLGVNPEENDMGQAIGAVAGRTSGDVTISGVAVSGLNISGICKYLGGIVGYGIEDGIVQNCTVDGIISPKRVNENGDGVSQMGGIVGCQSGESKHTADGINIVNCTVNATLGGDYEIAGGIVAQAANDAIGIEDCTFDGTLEPSTEYPDDHYKFGILAMLSVTDDNGPHPDYYIRNCSSGSYPKFGEYHDNIPEEKKSTGTFPLIDPAD